MNTRSAQFLKEKSSRMKAADSHGTRIYSGVSKVAWPRSELTSWDHKCRPISSWPRPPRQPRDWQAKKNPSEPPPRAQDGNQTKVGWLRASSRLDFATTGIMSGKAPIEGIDFIIDSYAPPQLSSQAAASAFQHGHGYGETSRQAALLSISLIQMEKQ